MPSNFDDQINVFTGPNNSGKSTVLWVLGELLVYPFSIPLKFVRSDQASWKLKYSTAEHARETPREYPYSSSIITRHVRRDRVYVFSFLLNVTAQEFDLRGRPWRRTSKPLLTRMWIESSRNDQHTRETWESKNSAIGSGKSFGSKTLF